MYDISISRKCHPLVLVDGPNAYRAMKGGDPEARPRFSEGRLKKTLLGEEEEGSRDFTRYYSVPPLSWEERKETFLFWMAKTWEVCFPSDTDRDWHGIPIVGCMVRDANRILERSSENVSRLVLVCVHKDLASVASAYRAAGIPVTVVCGSDTFLAPEEGDCVVHLEEIIPRIRLQESERKARSRRQKPSEQMKNARPHTVAE